MKITIRPLLEDDLPAADVVFRLAFGTLAGLDVPVRFGGDTDFVRTRWAADPDAAFVADSGGKPVGSIFAARWGSVGVLGPLTVHPNVWDRAVGTRLLGPAMKLFDEWGSTHVGLHSVVHSAKHIALFRKFGFWPRCLIEVMSKPVESTGPGPKKRLFSELSERAKTNAIKACRRITGSIYEGLNLEREIRATDDQELGDTALLYDVNELCGFAVCHWGPGTEAGSGRCYVKFGVVRKGPNAGKRFKRLLEMCEVLAGRRGFFQLVAGVHAARTRACRAMIERGFHTESVGVAMHRPHNPGYNRRDAYIIDDWR
ncbi:MAG: GNAT family N-acetyltransferase [Candidatus Latescibacterota bacterium]|nr:MAG: GNAT family N-acetyltransferase [Candidatus Latescibacterota bacterium]